MDMSARDGLIALSFYMANDILVIDLSEFVVFHDRAYLCHGNERGRMSNLNKALKIVLESKTPVSAADLRAEGISSSTIKSLLRAGSIESPARGLFRAPGSATSVYADWAVLAFKYPQAVVCLLSAAAFHGMTQELPGTLTVAVPREMGGTPHMGDQFGPDIDALIWRNKDMFELSVDKHRIDGVKVRITSPERTLVDLFRYSSFNDAMRGSAVRITDEMFLECLGRCNSEQMQHFSFDSVAAIAREFKCYQAMRPYTKTMRYVHSELPTL